MAFTCSLSCTVPWSPRSPMVSGVGDINHFISRFPVVVGSSDRSMRWRSSRSITEKSVPKNVQPCEVVSGFACDRVHGEQSSAAILYLGITDTGSARKAYSYCDPKGNMSLGCCRVTDLNSKKRGFPEGCPKWSKVRTVFGCWEC